MVPLCKIVSIDRYIQKVKTRLETWPSIGFVFLRSFAVGEDKFGSVRLWIGSGGGVVVKGRITL